jgi:hypothetical protein
MDEQIQLTNDAGWAGFVGGVLVSSFLWWVGG